MCPCVCVSSSYLQQYRMVWCMRPFFLFVVFVFWNSEAEYEVRASKRTYLVVWVMRSSFFVFFFSSSKMSVVCFVGTGRQPTRR